MGGADSMRIRRRPFDEIKRISINASRDVIVHSFDKDKMRRLGQDSVIPHRVKYKKLTR